MSQKWTNELRGRHSLRSTIGNIFTVVGERVKINTQILDFVREGNRKGRSEMTVTARAVTRRRKRRREENPFVRM